MHQTLYTVQKIYDWLIDLKKLIGYLKTKYQAKKVFFYFSKDDKNKKQEKFLNKLEEFGYLLRVKQVKWYGTRRKANCDVDLTMDALLFTKEYKRGIFLTGDGDFLPLLEYLKKKERKEIVIVSWPKRTARTLRKFAGENFVDFNNLRYLLERKH